VDAGGALKGDRCLTRVAPASASVQEIKLRFQPDFSQTTVIQPQSKPEVAKKIKGE
jgi:hypothetical protein